MRHLARRVALIGRPTCLNSRSPRSFHRMLRGSSSVQPEPIAPGVSWSSWRSMSADADAHASGALASAADGGIDCVPIHFREEQRRVTSEMPLEEYETFVSNLEDRTQRTLLELPDLSPTVRLMKISRLIWDWSQLWGHAAVTPSSYIGRGARLTDELVHALLDAKEANIDRSNSNTVDPDMPMKGKIQCGRGMKMEFAPLCDIAITGLAKSDLPGRGVRAQAILDRLEDIYFKSEGSDELAPTIKTYNATIDAWSKSDEDDAIDRCLTLLKRMDDWYSSGANTLVKRHLVAYNATLDAYARRGDARNAHLLLEEMERLWASGDDDLMPDTYSFSILINAWEKSGDPNAAQKAEDIILKMTDMHNRTGDKRVHPNQVTFGVCIALYARNPHEREGAANAERMLDWLIELYKKNDYNEELRPIATHFVTVMNCYAKSRRRDNASRAERILKKMEALYRETGSNQLKPNHQCFVICINAWVRSKHQDGGKHVEQLLNKMESLFLHATNPDERMNNYAYNIVTDYWARIGDKGSSKRIEHIIKRMTRLSRKTSNDDLAPDKLTYTSLLRALVNGRVPGYLQVCSSVLSMMERLADSGNPSVRPDTIAYSTLLNGYAQEGHVEQAEKMLQNMKAKQIQPTTFAYNMLIKAINVNDGNHAATKAEDVLRWMEREYRAGNKHCMPSIVSYISCINSLAKSQGSDRLDRAKKLYDEVVNRYKAGDDDFKPNLIIHSSLLAVIARSNASDKVAQALNLLSRMQDEYGLAPNRVIYNIILSACASTNFDGGASKDEQICQQVLSVAVSTFQRLRIDKSLGGVDSNSYKALLNVAQNLIQDDAERLASVEDLFRKCCEDGQVNQWVLQALLQAAPGPHFWRLVQKDRNHGIVRVDDLPAEWSRNVKQRRQRHSDSQWRQRY